MQACSLHIGMWSYQHVGAKASITPLVKLDLSRRRLQYISISLHERSEDESAYQVLVSMAEEWPLGPLPLYCFLSHPLHGAVFHHMRATLDCLIL